MNIATDKASPGRNLFTPADQAYSHAIAPAFMRAQCEHLFSLGLRQELPYWQVKLSALEDTAAYVADEIHRNYPDLQIPPLSRRYHINAGSVDRMQHLRQAVKSKGRLELARVESELLILSVILDAGAGHHWRYREASTGQTFTRSEGLAVASFDLYSTGFFSSRKECPLYADVAGLVRLSAPPLATGLQVSAQNPIVGLTGRALLLNALGDVIRLNPKIFPEGRLGHIFDSLVSLADEHGQVRASDIFTCLLSSFGSIWVGKLSVNGKNLGDSWHHPLAPGEGQLKGLVPLHQLPLWLTYSLFHLLQDYGLTITGVQELPGFPDYRSGGLFIDTGVLVAQDPTLLQRTDLRISDTEVVEWRALTVALLDRLAVAVAKILSEDLSPLSLPCLQQGGTWSAGRRIAYEHRADGAPPLRVQGDGIFC